MSRLRRLLATLALGVLIVALACVAGVAFNGWRLTGPGGGLDIGASSPAQGRPYSGDPSTEPALVAAEEARIDYVKSTAASVPWLVDGVDGAYRVPTTPASTLVLPARTEAYTLADLQDLAPETFVAQPDGSFLLSENLVALPGATLDMTSDAPPVVRMLSAPQSYVSIVVIGGQLAVKGSAEAAATFASFDPATGSADTRTADGRAYVRVIGGIVDLDGAAFNDLGFWSGDTGGLSLTGAESPGTGPMVGTPAEGAEDLGGAPTLSEEELAELAAEKPPTPGLVSGSIRNVTATGNAFGIFASRAAKLAITGTSVQNSLVDGIVLFRSVTETTIESTEAIRNAVDGIVVERSSSGISMTAVTASDNGRNGISIDARALADGPSATGTPSGEFGNVQVSNSTVADNSRYGIQVNGGRAIAITESDIRANVVGIALDDGSSGVEVTRNTLQEQERQSISIRGGVGETTVRENRFESVDTGVRIRGAAVVVEDNTFEDISNHAVTLVEQATGVRVTGNDVAGRGSTPFYDDATGGYFAGNDTEEWEKPLTPTSVVNLITQPLTLVWTALGVLLLFTAVTGYRRSTDDRSLERRPLTELSRGIVPVEAVRGRK
jgi:hypothetical protein